MADGPVIQMASEQAIKQGVGIYDTIEMVKMFRSNDQQTPIILMGYLNPVECMGNQNFVEQAKTAGVNGLLLVDSPPEESEDLLANLKQQDMDQIFFGCTNYHRSQEENDLPACIRFCILCGIKGCNRIS